MQKNLSYFCPCPRGLEAALAAELQEIAATSTTLKIHNQVPGGVHCSGQLTDAMRINLYSRIASRVLLRIAHGSYANENDIYDLTLASTWEQWFGVEHTIRVDVTAIKSPLKSLDFITLKIKDAICDRFRDREGKRPSVNTRTPDMRISGFLDARTATLYLDTSGEPLFKRGWRQETGDAPLRENLAAGLLRTAGWTPGIPLLDPMCGSGTLLIEAAHMLAGIPPGANRRFGFEKFHSFSEADWQAIREAVPAPTIPTDTSLFGSDISGDMLVMTRNNLQRAGIPFDIPLKQIDAQEIKPPTEQPGLLIANPPYGERIGVRGEHQQAPDELAVAFFSAFGSTLKSRFAGWTVCLCTADLTLPRMLRLKESKKTPFFNGAIECRLFRFEMVAGSNRKT
ncbi:MAG: class I SAM-dependent RNA methyltransferase [Oxalobacteraceae bacterium]